MLYKKSSVNTKKAPRFKSAGLSFAVIKFSIQRKHLKDLAAATRCLFYAARFGGLYRRQILKRLFLIVQ